MYIRSPIVTKPHYYGNVCSMYCIYSCCYAVHIIVFSLSQSECVQMDTCYHCSTQLSSLSANYSVPNMALYVHNLAPMLLVDKALELSSLSEFGSWSEQQLAILYMHQV